MAEMNEKQVTMAIDLKKGRLRIHKPTLRLLGSPPFVKLLFSTQRRAVVVLGCTEQLPRGEEIIVTYDKPDAAGTFDIYCKELISRIRDEFGGLEENRLYRLRGFSVSEEGGVYFPLATLALVEDGHVQDPE